MGLQLLLGCSGQFSIGQAAFYGIGAYTSALLTTKLGVAFPLALIGAGAAAAVASLLMVPITAADRPVSRGRHAGFLHHRLSGHQERGVANRRFVRLHRHSARRFVRLRAARSDVQLLPVRGCGGARLCLFARIEGTRFGRAINAVRQDAEPRRASGLRRHPAQEPVLRDRGVRGRIGRIALCARGALSGAQRFYLLEVDRDPDHGGDRRCRQFGRAPSSAPLSWWACPSSCARSATTACWCLARS